MFSIIVRTNSRHDAACQVACAGISLGVAEIFYHFHSFSLECLAFLATWFALDGIRLGVAKILERRDVQ